MCLVHPKNRTEWPILLFSTESSYCPDCYQNYYNCHCYCYCYYYCCFMADTTFSDPKRPTNKRRDTTLHCTVRHFSILHLRLVLLLFMYYYHYFNYYYHYLEGTNKKYKIIAKTTFSTKKQPPNS